jgi:hypothetical protein
MPKFGFVITGANAIVPRNSPGPKGFWMIFCRGNLENPVQPKKEGPDSLGGACPGLREEIKFVLLARCA